MTCDRSVFGLGTNASSKHDDAHPSCTHPVKGEAASQGQIDTVRLNPAMEAAGGNLRMTANSKAKKRTHQMADLTKARILSGSCGRLRFEATPMQRNAVRAMAAWGQPHENIAELLEIRPATLRQHFSDELLSGAIEAQSTITMKLFDQALSGDVGAMICWLKRRAGWKANNVVHPLYERKPNLPNWLVKALRKPEKCRNASTTESEPKGVDNEQETHSEKPGRPKSRGHGRPRFHATRSQRMRVRAMAARDAGHEYIARTIGISQPTLRAYFGKELLIGTTEAQTTIALKLYQKSVQGNVPAMIFWLKCRAGWNRNEMVHDTGNRKTSLPRWLLKLLKTDKKAKTSDADQRLKIPEDYEARLESKNLKLGAEGSERAAPHN